MDFLSGSAKSPDVLLTWRASPRVAKTNVLAKSDAVGFRSKLLAGKVMRQIFKDTQGRHESIAVDS